LGKSLEENELVHHKDLNHKNNTPGNLINITPSEHFKLHQNLRYGFNEKLPPIEKLVSMYNSGEYSIKTLAKKYNCDSSTISSRIKHLINFRTQKEEMLNKSNSPKNKKQREEAILLYAKGYTIYELSDFYRVHSTTILQWMKKEGGIIRTSSESQKLRQSIGQLPSLNHKVLSVLKGKTQDVYNMEVEEIENFFGDGVILHNCPITNQPDHAKIEIIYVPNEDMVESKSLKLYLFSFRNNGEFHEDVINRITNDLFAIMNPKYIRVFGDFASRGGIAIKPLVEKWNPLHGLRGYSPVESSTIVRLVEMWDRKRN
jgi:7-cyano-7-deazaguanine reductase